MKSLDIRAGAFEQRISLSVLELSHVHVHLLMIEGYCSPLTPQRAVSHTHLFLHFCDALVSELVLALLALEVRRVLGHLEHHRIDALERFLAHTSFLNLRIFMKKAAICGLNYIHVAGDIGLRPSKHNP